MLNLCNIKTKYSPLLPVHFYFSNNSNIIGNWDSKLQLLPKRKQKKNFDHRGFPPPPNFILSIISLSLLNSWGAGEKIFKNEHFQSIEYFDVSLRRFQIVHILNMTSAKILSYSLNPEESLHSLQVRIESDTGISSGNQELLLEMGSCLDPRKPASQCVIDGVVRFLLEF